MATAMDKAARKFAQNEDGSNTTTEHPTSPTRSSQPDLVTPDQAIITFQPKNQELDRLSRAISSSPTEDIFSTQYADESARSSRKALALLSAHLSAKFQPLETKPLEPVAFEKELLDRIFSYLDPRYSSDKYSREHIEDLLDHEYGLASLGYFNTLHMVEKIFFKRTPEEVEAKMLELATIANMGGHEFKSVREDVIAALKTMVTPYFPEFQAEEPLEQVLPNDEFSFILVEERRSRRIGRIIKEVFGSAVDGGVLMRCNRIRLNDDTIGHLALQHTMQKNLFVLLIDGKNVNSKFGSFPPHAAGVKHDVESIQASKIQQKWFRLMFKGLEPSADWLKAALNDVERLDQDPANGVTKFAKR